VTLPTFLIVGAGRSGTTTLYQALRRHPQVFMSPVKEPSYFVYCDRQLPDGPGAGWVRETAVTTLEEYEALFAEAGGARAIGEASPRYLSSAAAPERIHALLPEVRLVAILRNPVDRAFANYLGFRRDGFDPAPTFDAALDDQERRRREGWAFGAFLDFGLYARQLERYRRLFGQQQLRVYLFEDLVDAPAALSRDLLEFIGVDPEAALDLSERHGRTGELRGPLLGWLWRHSTRVRALVRPAVPLALRDAAFAWVMRGQRKPEMTASQRDRLLDFYADDITRLQELLQRDLSAWLN
jgi:hypothetical protein